MPMTTRIRLSGRRRTLRRAAVGAAVGGVAVVIAAVAFQSETRFRDGPRPGTPAWAERHYGDPDAPGFRARNIVPIEFLGRTMSVHRKATRHFMRLERLFEARSPQYAAAVRLGVLDDWSYDNRAVRGASSGKSNHAYGLAVDVNALANPLGTVGDIPAEVVAQWEIEGGEWGGSWSRPDPMHFETHLTPHEIRKRYTPTGVRKSGTYRSSWTVDPSRFGIRDQSNPSPNFGKLGYRAWS